MTESKVSVATRENLDAEKWFYYVEAAREIINLTIEQGLWVALMVDVWAITGKVYKYDENGEETFLWQQRYHIIQTLKFITKDEWINLFGFDIPKATGHLFGFLEPLEHELKKIGTEEGDPMTLGKIYYRPLDPLPRALAIFVIPAVLKLVMAKVKEGIF